MAKWAKQTRFYIDSDNHGRWFMIPVGDSEAWQNWIATSKDGVPDFALPIDGPNRMTFAEPMPRQ